MNQLLRLSLLFCFISPFLGHTQAINNLIGEVTPPTPEAAALGEYVDTPVSYATGTPNINIPIANLSEGSLSLPVSLSYHGAGIRVAEMASWVGTGWTLNAGGIISRTVQGIRDDEPGKGYLFTGNQAPYTDPIVVEQIINGDLDGEPDLFSFNFMGYSGKFYLNENKEAVFIPKQDLQLIVDPLSSPTGEMLPSFLIITPDGTKHYFGEARRDDNSLVRALEETTSTGENSIYKTNSWHLLRVVSADESFAIDLNYVEENYAYKTPANCQRTVTACNGSGFSSSSVDISCPVVTGYSSTEIYVSTQVKTHKLSSIVTARETLNFISTTERADLDPNTLVAAVDSKAEQLDAIEISTGTYCRKYDFTYNYFEDQRTGIVNRSEAKRLKLESIQQSDCESPTQIEIPPHTFEYYDGQTNTSNNSQFMPHRLDKAIDHWGYYNGQNNNNNERVNVPTTSINTPAGVVSYSTGVDREPSAHHMKFGSLVKITYPTGGFTEYSFEPHSYIGTSEVKEDLLSEGILKSCVGPYGMNCCDTKSVTSMDVNISNVANTRFDLMIDIDDAMDCSFILSSKVEVEILDAGGIPLGLPYTFPLLDGTNASNPNSNGRFNLPITDIYTDLSAGTYRIRLSSQEAFGRFSLYQTEGVSSEMIGGGLRIAKWKTHDGVDVANDVEQNYVYQPGLLFVKPKYGRYIEGINYLVTDAGANNIIQPITLQSAVFSAENLSPLSSYQGYPIGYESVEELRSLNKADNGYTQYRFRFSNTEYFARRCEYPMTPIQHNVFNESLASSASFLGSSNTNTLREEQHIPREPIVTQSPLMFRLSAPHGCPFTGGNPMDPASSWIERIYFTATYRISSPTQYQLLEKTESLDGVSTTTTYAYDEQNRHLFPTLITMTNSDDTKYSTHNKYPLDYGILGSTDDAGIKALQDRHIINTPIEVLQTVQRRNRIEQLTQANLTTYKNTGFPYADKFWTTELNVPIPLEDFQTSSISGNTFVKDDAHYTHDGNQTHAFEYVDYDDYGNLTEYQLTDDQPNAFLWDAYHTKRIAVVQNAEADEVFYTGFELNESSASEEGGWTFRWYHCEDERVANHELALAGEHAVAGHSAYVLYGNTNGDQVQANISKAGIYILSLWALNRQSSSNAVNVAINGGFIFQFTLSDQWERYEIRISLPANSELRLTGGAFIDELRLHPEDALMNTYSYEYNSHQLVSTSDESNVPTSFEYDDLLRLNTIRDFENKIIQTSDYFYHDDPSGIGQNAVYSQSLIAEETNRSAVDGLNISLTNPQVNRSYQFFDGINRAIQQVDVQASPDLKDRISFLSYDEYGRKERSYLPYTQTTSASPYRTSPLSEQQSFYAGLAGSGVTTNDANFAFMKDGYEASPLNRTTAQTPAGSDWQNKAVTTSYRANTVADSVHDFNNGYRNSDIFPAGELYVVETTDEDFNKSRTYLDKMQRVVMVEREIDASTATRTYTVYDDFGNKRAVIPPQAAEDMKQANNWNIQRLKNFRKIYAYTYDDRQRPRAKYVPGGGTSIYHHNKLDLPVMQTDDNERQTITKYDILKRPVITGEYMGTLTPDTDSPSQVYETTDASTHGYSFTNSFPTDANAGGNLRLHQVNYYDEYQASFATPPTAPEYESEASDWVRGKLTATKLGILTATGMTNSFLNEHIFYDGRARVIQTQSDNHLGGKDVVHNAYNFPGWLVKMQRDHDTDAASSVGAQDYTIKYRYEHDHTGRVIRVYHQAIDNQNGITGADQLMVENEYDERDFLEEKRLHRTPITSAPNDPKFLDFWQYVDYRYNIRSWLTDINNVNFLSHCAQSTVARTPEGKEQTDLFSMKLGYQAGGLFNGNIARMTWRTGCSDDKHEYRFTYDGINRLLSGIYRRNDAVSGDYNMGGLQYDLDGNIELLIRNNADGVMDYLRYVYNPLIPNHLDRAFDTASPTEGFKQNSNAAITYNYDDAGNLIRDEHKSADFLYNYMNLPKRVNFDSGDNIQWTYRADGQKLTKAVSSGTSKQYCNGIEYNNTDLEAIYHEEGRVVKEGAAWQYQYHLTDHLGNVRVVLSDTNGDHEPEILQDQAYYPFGLEIADLSMSNLASPNGYRYNGKELNEEFGLDWYCYGFRNYDPILARFPSVDPIADQFAFVSPFNYAENTPINAIDLHGLQAFYVHGTWSDSDTWKELKKEGYKSIELATGNTTHIDEFNWSGLNLSSARTAGANNLVQEILAEANGKEPITMIGHSHGGNVIIEAVNILAKSGELEELGDVNIITINTPVRDDYQLSETASENVNHFNIYDPSDPVQVRGGNDPEQYDDGRRTGGGRGANREYQAVTEGGRNLRRGILSGEHGPAERTFKNANNFRSRRRISPTNFHNTHNNPKDWNSWLKSTVKETKTKKP